MLAGTALLQWSQGASILMTATALRNAIICLHTIETKDYMLLSSHTLLSATESLITCILNVHVCIMYHPLTLVNKQTRLIISLSCRSVIIYFTQYGLTCESRYADQCTFDRSRHSGDCDVIQNSRWQPTDGVRRVTSVFNACSSCTAPPHCVSFNVALRCRPAHRHRGRGDARDAKTLNLARFFEGTENKIHFDNNCNVGLRDCGQSYY